nr:hypothetical protein [uncultured archaeon]
MNTMKKTSIIIGTAMSFLYVRGTSTPLIRFRAKRTRTGRIADAATDFV